LGADGGGWSVAARRRETAQSARLRGRCASIGRADVALRATRALYAAVRQHSTLRLQNLATEGGFAG